MAGPKIDWSKFNFAPDYDAKDWWEFTKQGKLMVRTCNACGHNWWPPSSIGCSFCGEFENTGWVEAPARGTVHSFIVVAQPILAAFIEAVPYVSAVIDLEVKGNTGLPLRIQGVVDEGDDKVGINSRVDLYWDKVSADGKQVPRWRLAAEQPSNVWLFPGP